MDTPEQFAENPGCRKCAAQAPLNRPEYVYHEKQLLPGFCPETGEHIHLGCRRCGYKWIMATQGPPITTPAPPIGLDKEAAESIRDLGAKWYNKPPLGRLLVPDMPNYQEKTERFEENEKTTSRKIGWRKPAIKGLTFLNSFLKVPGGFTDRGFGGY